LSATGPLAPWLGVDVFGAPPALRASRLKLVRCPIDPVELVTKTSGDTPVVPADAPGADRTTPAASTKPNPTASAETPAPKARKYRLRAGLVIPSPSPDRRSSKSPACMRSCNR